MAGRNNRRSSWLAPSGNVALGYHASGHPIFDQDLLLPTSMTYSTDHIYDNTPAQNAMDQDSQRESAAASKAYNNLTASTLDHASGHKGADADFGQPCLKCKTCPGFNMHPWRKTCKWCRCSRINHRSKEVVERRAKLLATGSEAKRYAWMPQDLSPEDVAAYFACLPVQAVPLVGSEGEIWRHQQLYTQMPPWDTDPGACDHLTAEELASFRRMDEMRLRKVFDIGEVVRCPDLRQPPTCAECKLRSDGTHWAYCSQFNERSGSTSGSKGPGARAAAATATAAAAAAAAPAPVAAAELPLSERSIKTMKKKGAADDNASAVEAPLPPPPAPPAAAQSVPENAVWSGARCRGCSDKLFINEMVVTVSRLEQANSFFHPRCFSCSHCGELLVDLRCHVDIGREERGNKGAEMRLFCGRHWAENLQQRCYGCDEVIHQRDHVFEFNKAFHMRHFCCAICDVQLTDSKTFIPLKKKPHCFLCYAEHYADKCTACDCAINPSPGQGGKMTIGDQHWHAVCFVCVGCDTPLEGKPCMPSERGLQCKSCFKKSRK